MTMADTYDDGLPGDDGDATDPSIEEQARAAGWRPFADWRFAPEDWKTAEEFLEVVEKEFPVARETARRLTKTTARLQRELQITNERLIAAQNETMSAVRDMGAQLRTADERAMARARAELNQQKDAAVEAGDLPTFRQIEAELAELDKAAAPPAPAAQPAPAPQAVPAADKAILDQWVADNPWYLADAELRKAMIANHTALRQTRPTMPLAQQLEVAKQRVIDDMPDRFDPEEIEVAQPPQRPAAAPPPTFRRVPPAVSRPGGVQPGGAAQRRTVWDEIADPTERTAVQREFERFKASNQDPDMPASEYVAIYLNPKLDVLELRRQRKKA